MVKELAIRRPPASFPKRPRASTPLALNKAFLDHFVSAHLAGTCTATILLPFSHTPVLLASQGKRTLAHTAPASGLGPNMTPNSIWKTVNKTAPDLILNLLFPLVAYASHPPWLKTADGIVPDKLDKPS